MRRIITLGALALATAVVVIPAALAATQLDQDHLYGTGGPTDSVEGSMRVAQTFTAGVDGFLTSVVVRVSNDSATEPLEVRIVGVAGGLPDAGDVRATGSLPSASVPVDATDLSVSFGAPAEVHVGEQYAILLSTSDGAGYRWHDPDTTSYGGGAGYIDVGGWHLLGWDKFFQTYVSDSFRGPSRGAYCVNGSFMDLALGQPDADSAYKGAAPAIFVEGKGLTCDPPPAGWVVKGYTDAYGGAGMYAHYAPAA